MEVRVREVRSGMHPSRFSLRPLSALFPSRSFSPRPPLDSHRRFLTHLTQMRQKGCGRLDEDSPSLNTGGMRRSVTTRQGNTGGMRRSATTTRQHRWHAECDDGEHWVVEVSVGIAKLHRSLCSLFHIITQLGILLLHRACRFDVQTTCDMPKKS